MYYPTLALSLSAPLFRLLPLLCLSLPLHPSPSHALPPPPLYQDPFLMPSPSLFFFTCSVKPSEHCQALVALVVRQVCYILRRCQQVCYCVASPEQGSDSPTLALSLSAPLFRLLPLLCLPSPSHALPPPLYQDPFLMPSPSLFFSHALSSARPSELHRERGFSE